MGNQRKYVRIGSVTGGLKKENSETERIERKDFKISSKDNQSGLVKRVFSEAERKARSDTVKKYWESRKSKNSKIKDWKSFQRPG